MEYTFKVEGTYIGGSETITISGQELTITTDEIITMQFSLTNETITHNSYMGDIEITYASSNIVTKAAYLFLGDTQISELVLTATDTTFAVEGLLNGTEYVLKVIYTATPSGGGADLEITEVLTTFTTIPVPAFVSISCEVGFADAECDIDVDETGFTDVTLFVEVWQDGLNMSRFDVIESVVDVIELDSETEYKLKLYIEYKVEGSDELIRYVLLHEETFTTLELLAYTTPSIENLTIETLVGETELITIDFDFLDPDNTLLEDVYYVLNPFGYDEAGQISVGHNTIVVDTRVYPNLEYTLTIRASYSEDGDNDVWNQYILDESFLTPSAVEVTSFTQHKSMYFHSDQIIFVLELDNYDEDQTIEYVTINGDKYYAEHFLFPSNLHTIYINMGVETDYTDYNYHMTNFAVTMVDGSSQEIEYDETISFRLQKPGDIDPSDAEINVIDITTDDLIQQVTTSTTDHATITVHLENEYNLDVHSLKVGGVLFPASSFETGSTAKQIVLYVEMDSGYNNYNVSELVYIVNDVEVDAVASNYQSKTLTIRGYYIEDSVTISSVEEFNSINPTANKIYVLTADLDFTGYTVSPKGTKDSSFQGIFDGQGHTISNYSYTLEEVDQDQNVYVGIFGYSYALIYNLNIYNSSITVNTNEDHTLYVGTLAGYSGGQIIDCTVFGSSTITINGMTQGYVGGLAGKAVKQIKGSSADTDIMIDGLDIDKALGIGADTYVGGLVGVAGSFSVVNVETSSADGTITIVNTVNNTNIVGGLIGQFVNSTSAYATRNYVLRSFASVDIWTTNYGYGRVGGLIGLVNNEYATNTEIRNSYATGDIYSERGYIGGLIGESWAYISNSFATGSISSDSGSGYVFAEVDYDHFLSNNYVYDAQTVSYDGNAGYIPDDVEGGRVTASVDEYNDEWFYTEVLNWNPYFWDFDSLIVTADIMPTHK